MYRAVQLTRAVGGSTCHCSLAQGSGGGQGAVVEPATRERALENLQCGIAPGRGGAGWVGQLDLRSNPRLHVSVGRALRTHPVSWQRRLSRSCWSASPTGSGAADEFDDPDIGLPVPGWERRALVISLTKAVIIISNAASGLRGERVAATKLLALVTLSACSAAQPARASPGPRFP